MSSHSRGRAGFDGPLEEYRSDFLDCRDVGHHWTADPHWEITTKAGRVIEYRRQFYCAHCPAVRRDTYDKNLDRVASYTKYPDGYLMRRQTPLRRAEVRQEQLRRAGHKGARLRSV